MYFPQFHVIPENEEWWGEGFTDWDHVRSAQPQFPGHYQPRIPLGERYYDQSQLETVRWQVELAKRHGVYGFCHYHYWFDGAQLLEAPTELVLANQELDLPFCLSWANETWSRRWEGRDHQVLIRQTHPPRRESWRRHYEYLVRAWSDPRAIKVNGRPVFVIYRPHRIRAIEQMLDYWRELALKDGLPGLYFIYQKQYELPNSDCLSAFDAQFEFQPFAAVNSPGFADNTALRSSLYRLVRWLPERHQDWLRGLRTRLGRGLTVYDYDAVWRYITESRPSSSLTTFPGAFADWDNTARYKSRAVLFRGASPEAFAKWLDTLVASMPERGLPEDLIFLNAWNEWSEGAYLEPDTRYGLRYLEALREVLAT